MKTCIARRALASLVLIAGVLISGSGLAAEEFRFKYVTGDKYRVLSTVDEDIYINRRYYTSTEILNRISFSVTDTKGSSGVLDGVFQTSDRSKDSSGQSFSWAREYRSIFTRDERGRYDIGEEYWMPVVRNVPIFPEGPVKAGDSWTHEGEEVHDFRDGFGIAEPFRIPFSAKYTYRGPELVDGKEFHVILVSYRIFHEPDRPASSNGRWPVRIMGASDQVIYWDSELGQFPHYTETFRFILEVSDGNSIEYRGTAEARFLEAAFMDRDRIAREINDDLRRQGLDDTNATATDDGVSISMENLRFKANTTELLPGETDKLGRIAAILRKYEDRDILIKGHTASTGAVDKELELSRMRAAAIAEYLIAGGIRSRDRIVVRGYGASMPVAPNDSEKNMARNRRVEIVLLEN